MKMHIGFLHFLRQDAAEKFINISLCRRLHDLPQGLAFLIQPQGRDAADIFPLPDAVKFIHVDFYYGENIGIFIGDLIVGAGDPAAVAAPIAPGISPARAEKDAVRVVESCKNRVIVP